MLQKIPEMFSRFAHHYSRETEKAKKVRGRHQAVHDISEGPDQIELDDRSDIDDDGEDHTVRLNGSFSEQKHLKR